MPLDVVYPQQRLRVLLVRAAHVSIGCSRPHWQFEVSVCECDDVLRISRRVHVALMLHSVLRHGRSDPRRRQPEPTGAMLQSRQPHAHQRPHRPTSSVPLLQPEAEGAHVAIPIHSNTRTQRSGVQPRRIEDSLEALFPSASPSQLPQSLTALTLSSLSSLQSLMVLEQGRKDRDGEESR